MKISFPSSAEFAIWLRKNGNLTFDQEHGILGRAGKKIKTRTHPERNPNKSMIFIVQKIRLGQQKTTFEIKGRYSLVRMCRLV